MTTAAAASTLDLAAAHPPYAEAQAQLNELVRERRETADELAGPALTVEATAPRPSLARRLLGGDRTVLEPQHEEAVSSPEHRRLTHRLLVLDEAIDEQRQVLRGLATPASRVVLERIAPEHRAVGRRLALALLELAEATTEWNEHRAELQGAGVQAPASPPVLRSTAVDQLPHGRHELAMWLRVAADAGFVGAHEVPSEIRGSWPRARVA